jgi:hypothetical protein
VCGAGAEQKDTKRSRNHRTHASPKPEQTPGHLRCSEVEKYGGQVNTALTYP